jgi:signal recognition particle receptor subunit beta
MVSINYATREVSCKIVYYGPGLSGKTTNLQYVHQKVPSNTKGKLISLATDADRTLYFDFLPINIGTINGFASKFQLYTVPGQVYYNATRKLVLRGVDGLVFVADSQPDKMDENIESLNNLKENLAEYGYKVDELPIVIQYNKQDLPNVLSSDEMRPILNPDGRPEFKASATEGFGVFDTLKCILKLVLEKAKAGGTAQSAQPTPRPGFAPNPAPAGTAAVAPPTQPETPAPPAAPPAAPQPVTPMAPAAQARDAWGTPDRSRPITDRRPQPAAAGPIQETAPEPVEQPADIKRESVSEASETASPSDKVYRPFPGNTAEDEQKMMRFPGDGASGASAPYGQGQTGQATPPPYIETNTQTSRPIGAPHMAPSLKADKPRKKRSFFKRLFGLK